MHSSPGSKPTIVWFRQDLRLDDNPALSSACQRSKHIIPLFIWAPEEETPWQPGAASRWWLHQSLTSLNAALRRHRSALLIQRGPTLKTLLDVARVSGAEAIYWNRRYEPAVVVRDK